MPVSIKRNTETAEGCGITSGTSYPVQGFIGGGVMIVDDNAKFQHVGFADIDTDWSVEVDNAKKAAKKPEPEAEPEATT